MENKLKQKTVDDPFYSDPLSRAAVTILRQAPAFQIPTTTYIFSTKFQ